MFLTLLNEVEEESELTDFNYSELLELLDLNNQLLFRLNELFELVVIGLIATLVIYVLYRFLIKFIV